jgi:glutathione S-transferase
MKPKLISFKLCPFVQKAVLTLLRKDIDFEIEYIDLENPPQWFTDISPLGKVPLLKVGDHVLFESSVIIEYIDEVYGESLQPSDPLLKAQNRSWIEFSNECLMNIFNLIVATDQSAFEVQRSALLNKLDHLERKLGSTLFFNGEEVSLVDLSFTPFFQRLTYVNEVTNGFFDTDRHPRVNLWAQRLMSMEIVKKSTVPEISQLYTGMMKKRNGYLASLMAA